VRQPFLGGPAVQATLKYYCFADSDKRPEPKVQASRRQRFFGGPKTRNPNLLNPRTSSRVAVPVHVFHGQTRRVASLGVNARKAGAVLLSPDTFHRFRFKQIRES
jgi:hypothetical protein